MKKVAEFEAKLFKLDEPDNLDDWDQKNIIVEYDYDHDGIIGVLRWSRGHPYDPDAFYLDSICSSKPGTGTKMIDKYHEIVGKNKSLLIVDRHWDRENKLFNWYSKLGYQVVDYKTKNPDGVLMQRG